MRTQRGFTLIELLIAINASMLVMNLILGFLWVLRPIDVQFYLRQNRNGILQLRQQFALCHPKRIESNRVLCAFNQSEYEFAFLKDKLIKQPGYVVYLERIKDGSFETKNNTLNISFSVEGERVHAILAYID